MPQLTLLLLLLIFYGALLSFPEADIFFGDPGAGWHLVTGQLISSTWRIPRTDPYLTLGGSNPPIWIYGQWASDVVSAYLLAWGGFSLLYCFFTGLCLFPFLLAAGEVRLAPLSILLIVPFLLLAASIQWLFRPIVFSFFLLALLVLLLRRSPLQNPDSPRYWSLFLLFFLWANFHPAFVIGFLLLLCHLASAIIAERRLRWPRVLVLALTCFGATLINPWGPYVYQEILSLGGSGYFLGLNREWLPPTFSEFAFAPFFVAAVAFLFCCVFDRSYWREPVIRGEVIFALVLMLFSFNYRRFIPFFTIAALGPLTGSLSRVCELRYPGFGILSKCQVIRAQTSATVFLGAWLLIMVVGGVKDAVWQQPLVSEQEAFASYPERLVNEIKGLRGRYPSLSVFHEPELGGYLTYRLWPPRIASIDDRNLLVSREQYESVDRAFQGITGWDTVLKDRRPDLLLALDSHPVTVKLREAGWNQLQSEKTSAGIYFLFSPPQSGLSFE